MSEARTTNRARGGKALEVLVHPPLRRLVSTRPGRHQRALATEQRSACYLGKFSLDSKIWSSGFFVCHHDETTKKRDQKIVCN